MTTKMVVFMKVNGLEDLDTALENKLGLMVPLIKGTGIWDMHLGKVYLLIL